MKIHFQALGCRLNEAELEQWSSEFIGKGYELSHNPAEADLVVFNSCAVTQQADRKSRKTINRIKRENPDAQLVVTGCYASMNPSTVVTDLGIDLVIGNDQKHSLVSRVEKELSLTPSNEPALDQHSVFSRGRHRAFVKIQDGCRYRCTYCIVTLARGEERSRSQQSIIGEINRLHQSGIEEVVLTGVHVGGYGSDTDSSLYHLVASILEQTSIPRLRFASVEPWDLPGTFFDLFTDERLMPHMHLPLQSGSDKVLRRMSRRCKTAEFASLVERARAFDPSFNITTDIIVGFPGETEQDWRETVEFVQGMGFGHIHVFPFSPRKGTKAASFDDRVEINIQKSRSTQLHEIALKSKSERLNQMLGCSTAVLWEKPENDDEPHVYGYTHNYHRIMAKNAAAIRGIQTVKIESVEQSKQTLIAQVD